MKAFKTILIAVIGISCVFFGCAKKPKQPEQNTVVPSTTGQAVKKDSGDIFNGFYNDSAVALDKVKNIKTFSLKPSKNSTTAAATEENTPGSYTPVFSDNGPFVVQVASMRSRVLADELATEFKEKGYPSYTIEVQNPTPALNGTFYRVRIGGFATSIDAKAFSENILVPAHFDFWVDRKSNESSSPLESQFGQGSSSSGTSAYIPQGSSPSTYPPPTETPPPPPKTYESTIIPGPGAIPPATSGQTPAPSSTGGWSDSSSKW